MTSLVVVQEEVRLPLMRQEGPIGLIVCPSRELAKQTFDVIKGFTDELEKVLPNSKSHRTTICCLGTLCIILTCMTAQAR